MKYDFSTNITVKELEDMIAYAKSIKMTTIGIHFKSGALINQVKVSDVGSAWKDYKSHIDVTDWDSA